MATGKNVTIGYIAHPYFKRFLNANNFTETVMYYISNTDDVTCRSLLTFKKYLEQYPNLFAGVNIALSVEDDIFPNSAAVDLVEKINRSEIDIGFQTFIINEVVTERVDFFYPYGLDDYSFFIRKPKYKPQIFGIFQTFSMPVWISIAIAIIVMSALIYILLNWKCTLSKSFLHVFAILMRQSSIIIPISFGEKLLIYSWVVGAMCLCLAYDSVFLSFLSFPPVVKIKHLTDLATFVKSGDYQCMYMPTERIKERFLTSKKEHLKIIGEDLKAYNLTSPTFYIDMFNESNNNIAHFAQTRISYFPISGKFIKSEDRFLESMSAMIVGKGFCCKKLLDNFVHKMMSSGIDIKYKNDAAFWFWLNKLPEYEENDTKRKLTLTDVAPAFIFLLCGYFISFLVLIGEICIDRKKKFKYFKNNKKRKNRNLRAEHSV